MRTLGVEMKLSRGLLARNSFYNLLGQGLPVVVAVLAMPALVKGLGTDRFGVLALAWVIIGYFSLFDLGLGRALTQYVAERLGKGQQDDMGPVVRSALIFISALGLVGTTVVALLTQPLVRDALNVPELLRPETVRAFYILAISIPFVISTAALRGVLEGYQLFGLTNALRIPLGMFTYLGPLLVLPFSHDLSIVVAVLLLGRLVGWVAHLVLCMKYVPSIRGAIAEKSAGWSSLRSMLRFGGWMTVSNIVGPLMVTLDRFLIGAIVSVTAVAYYAAPSQAISQLLIIPASIVGVMFPAFALMEVQDRQKNAILFARVVKYVFVVLFPIAIVVMTLAHEGLRVWLGVEFANNAGSVLRWLTVGIFLNGLAFVPLALLQGIGRPDLTAKLHLIELPAYLAALWWLTSTRGVEGAAIAFTARVALDTVVLFVIVGAKLTGGAQIVRRVGVATAAALLTFAVATKFGNIYAQAAFMITTLSAFALSVWFVFLASDERTLILRSLRVRSL